MTIAQDFHQPMQPVADYSQCVSERARTVEVRAASIEEAINDGMAGCKRLRSRALSATQARMKALGLPASTVKQSAKTTFASMEASMKETSGKSWPRLVIPGNATAWPAAANHQYQSQPAAE